MTPQQALSDWSPEELGLRLASDGVRLELPPFVFRIQSRIPVVAEALRTLYGDHRCWPGSDGFSDFHVSVVPRLGFFKRLCVFEMDGVRPFTPLAIGEAFAFLEWGMNWCVTSHCHLWLTIHSAVLEKAGRVVILPAPPGSGKSTLCAALMLHGWRLLSDEMTLLDPESGLVQPFPRAVSLKNESIEVIRRLDSSVAMGPVAHDTMKGHVAHLKMSDASRLQAHVPASPAWVVFPRFVRGAALQAQARPKAGALVELASNSFNHHVHGRSGFEALTRLIDQCDCYDFAYGQLADALAWFDALEPPT
ncbi:HprK-related kinase A [Hydrogenophaga sp.]|uniref:HprK-related kinase A n=1 Tax=Hydrogenophaga sp. TaxID=1904254 RepID=UPI003569F3C0